MDFLSTDRYKDAVLSTYEHFSGLSVFNNTVMIIQLKNHTFLKMNFVITNWVNVKKGCSVLSDESTHPSPNIQRKNSGRKTSNNKQLSQKTRRKTNDINGATKIPDNDPETPNDQLRFKRFQQNFF